MGVNNFKKLEELEMENVSMKYNTVKNNIGSNLGSLRFLTNVVELFFPKVVDLIVGLTGGTPRNVEKSKKNPQSKYPDMR